MDKNRIGQHISGEFNSELADITNRVMLMGGLVEQQLRDALEALTEGNTQLGAMVVASDYKVNALDVAIDEECTQIIARRQPAASDLRLIIAVLKSVTDLERIGDEAEGIAQVALGNSEGDRRPNVEIGSLGRHVRQMVHDALDAFAHMDVDRALQVAREEEKVDGEYEAIVRQLMTFVMEDPRSISRTIALCWAARALERVADHTRNICEYIVYLVKGKDVRHLSLDQMEKAARQPR